MFSGILTKLLGGALIISLLGSGVLYVKEKWQAARFEKEIHELQDAAIKYQATIYKLQAQEKDKQVVIKYREIKSHEIKEIDRADAAPGDANLERIARDYGMLPPDAAGPGKNAGGGPGR